MFAACPVIPGEEKESLDKANALGKKIDKFQTDGYLTPASAAAIKKALVGCSSQIEAVSYDIEGALKKVYEQEPGFTNKADKQNQSKTKFEDGLKNIDLNNPAKALEDVKNLIGETIQFICEKRPYTPPAKLTPEQEKASEVLQTKSSRTKEGVMADVTREASGKPFDVQVKLWKAEVDKADEIFSKLPNPSANDKAKHDNALSLKKQAEDYITKSNLPMALLKYKNALNAQPDSVFQTK